MGMWGQAAFWVVLALIVWAVLFSVMDENTTKIFNAGVRGLARSGGDISADSIIDIYAGARERSRDKFTKRDLARIEHSISG